MLGESDTESIPSQKRDTKHRVFIFLSVKQAHSSAFTVYQKAAV